MIRAFVGRAHASAVSKHCGAVPGLSREAVRCSAEGCDPEYGESGKGGGHAPNGLHV